jgi:hypothetical protein
MLAEVLHHNLHLLRDVVRVEPHPAHNPLHRRAALDRRFVVLLPVVRQLEREPPGSVVLEHVQNEAFLDGLAHGVDMERSGKVVRRGLPGRVRASAEQLHRLRLRGGSEGDERDAANIRSCRHLRRQDVFRAHLATVV